ncbi:DUF397 domain-containing protein [Actinomadura rugatobispora]|uniref:DUF397 domain-containing protein n=1 Tax=Actinomadura rugatobispora TaxID=1994 RepID=A0ABW1AEP1_9ACTN
MWRLRAVATGKHSQSGGIDQRPDDWCANCLSMMGAPPLTTGMNKELRRSIAATTHTGSTQPHMRPSRALVRDVLQKGIRMESSKFRKSSRCEELNQTGCVEVADGTEFVAVRDSTDRNGPVIRVAKSEWRRLVRGLRSL